MKVRDSWGLAIALGLLLATGVAQAGSDVFVSKGDALFFGEGDGEVFDLAELLDGETRIFGEGEHQISATRAGDEITITRPNRDGKEIKITCNVEQDSCQVLTNTDGDHVGMMIRKTGTCAGSGCRHEDVDVVVSGEHARGHAFFVTEHADCEGEDCATVEVRVDEIVSPHGHAEVIVETVGEGGTWVGSEGHTVQLKSHGATLRCPEGDTTMIVDAEEVDDTFLCPKHSVPLEKMEPRVIRVQRKKVQDDD
jgi:hypothetical protein